jgi:hypothetical protein
MPHSFKQKSFGRQWEPAGFGSAVVSTVAKTIAADFGFTTAQLNAAKRAVVSSHGGRVHVRWDGVAPTATVGMMLFDDTSKHFIVFGRSNVAAMQFIKESGGPDATISIQLEK